VTMASSHFCLILIVVVGLGLWADI
jgi:hypothetical protein